MEKVGKIGALGLLFSLLIAYMFFEASTLSISRFDFPFPNSSPIKIALLSDLHLHKMGPLEKKLRRTLSEEKPDLILIAGDTLDSQRSLLVARDLFGELKPRLGILAAVGNWENWEHLDNPSLFQSFGATLLKNAIYKTTDGISVLSLDDLSGDPNLNLTQPKPENNFCIALIHSPIMFESVSDSCPLVLAGHTHGGQVRIPLLGPMWLPEGSGKYISGWYSRNNSKLYVSRGIGTSILPIRFLSSPELVLISLKKQI